MSTPLRTVVNDLLHDASARAAFSTDPAEYLGGHGWHDLDGSDVGSALDALVQELPIADAARLSPIAHGDQAYGADGSGAVAGLQAAAAAFDDVDAVGTSLDPALTLDDTADDVGDAPDDPSRGIDDEHAGSEGDERRDDDDMGTLDDPSAPGSPLSSEHDDEAVPEVDLWVDDGVPGVDADTHADEVELLDPLGAAESFDADDADAIEGGDVHIEDDLDDG